MDQSNDLNTWRALLDQIESLEYKVRVEDLKKLEKLFKHLPTQVALRIQKDFEGCVSKSEQVFGNLFDRIDLSDKPLLCSHLSMLRSFAFFRLAQITYHVPNRPNEDLGADPIHSPTIVKVKWYDMSPILPLAGTIGWKAIMNHGLVKEETQMLQICLQLLSFKLQFLSVVYLLDRYRDIGTVVFKNGRKVAEKLFELIRDVAYDDESMIGLDSYLFNLLLPFTDEDQQAVVIDAAVQDLFKPYLIQRPVRQEGIDNIHHLIHDCIMNKVDLQSILFTRLFEHLKCNVVRRKRRHSVETSTENGVITSTIESILSDIGCANKLEVILPETENLDLTSKSLQSSYILYWVSVMDRIVSRSTLTALTSLKIISTCSILLVAGSEIIGSDLIISLSTLMAKTIENTGQGHLDYLFNTASPSFMIHLTKKLSDSEQIFSLSDSPMLQFYELYLNRFLRRCVLRGAKEEAVKLTDFITFICDKSINKNVANLLQCVVIHQLSNCLKSFKENNQILEIYLEFARTCSKKLYKFIKKHSPLNSIDDENDSNYTHLESEPKKMIALVCILTIAIERKDQDMLDHYGNLLIKLFNFMISRLKKLNQSVKIGASGTLGALDPHLPKLLILYTSHKNVLKAYLDYDLIESIVGLLILDGTTKLNGIGDELKNHKKLVYNNIKTKLEDLESRANKSQDVYPTIINKQYSSIEQNINPLGDIKRESSCCHNYWQQIKSVNLVSAIILRNCDSKTYTKVLENTVNWLEQCDPLDHPRVLYLLTLLEALIPNYSPNDERFGAFNNAMHSISCSFIRITKSVELGPSIHAFTRSGNHKSSSSIQCCSYTICIKIYATIFQRFPHKVFEPLIQDAMQICVSANLIQYAKQHRRYFLQLGGAMASLLKSVSKKNDKPGCPWMPIFLSVLSHLVRCLILASDKYGQDDTKEFELLAIGVGVTLTNLSLLKLKFIDFAPHLISSYIKDIQRASCPDLVKSHLNEGIFRIFNLIDAHQKERQEDIMESGVQRKTIAGRAKGSLFEMIHARLDQASREIFRDLHEEYDRFHRYQAKC